MKREVIVDREVKGLRVFKFLKQPILYRSVSQGNEYSYLIKNINLSTDKQGIRPSCKT